MLQREMPTLFSKSLRISWIREGPQFATLEEGQIVLYVKDNPNANEILADTTMLYIQKGVNFEARPYIDRPLVESIDIALAQRLLVNVPLAYESLQEKYIKPQLQYKSQRKLYELACTLDDYGVLTRIVMSEFSSLGLRQRGMTPTAFGRAETVRFAEFVRRIVTRNDDVVPLRFSGKLFNSTVALIARPESREWSGFRHYQRLFRNDIESGVRIIHLLGRGNQNEVLIRRLSRWALKSKLVAGIDVRDFVEATPDGIDIRAICVTCFSARVMTARDFNPVHEMYSALYEIVPETFTGEIEIVAIAREPNAKSKIVIRSSHDFNAIEKCVGTNDKNILELRVRLGADEELIDFILWEADPFKLITKALYPLRESEILDSRIDKETATAMISLLPTDFMGSIIGKDGINMRLAQQVTGYKIDFVEREAFLSLEEVAVQGISDSIKSISDGKIVVRHLVRHPERIKLFVSSSDFDDPAQVCKNEVVLERLATAMTVKHIDFINWDESIVTRIINSLAPLNPTEVVMHRVNEKNKTITIYVLTVQSQRGCRGLQRKERKGCRRSHRLQYHYQSCRLV